jgi:hypothetical protein
MSIIVGVGTLGIDSNGLGMGTSLAAVASCSATIDWL